MRLDIVWTQHFDFCLSFCSVLSHGWFCDTVPSTLCQPTPYAAHHTVQIVFCNAGYMLTGFFFSRCVPFQNCENKSMCVPQLPALQAHSTLAQSRAKCGSNAPEVETGTGPCPVAQAWQAWVLSKCGGWQLVQGVHRAAVHTVAPTSHTSTLPTKPHHPAARCLSSWPTTTATRRARCRSATISCARWWVPAGLQHIGFDLPAACSVSQLHSITGARPVTTHFTNILLSTPAEAQ